MRLFSRFLALMLVLCIALGAFVGFCSAAEAPGSAFVDIQYSAYREDILRAGELGLMRGMDETHFQPRATMTRAMFLVTLFRAHRQLAGDTQSYACPVGWLFADVQTGSWYAEAVYWAYGRGITAGMDSTHFGPDENVTRQQAATFLYRYETQLGSRADSAAYLGSCADSYRIADYARRAMMWLVATDSRLFSPQQLLPTRLMLREELAHLLVHYVDSFHQSPVIGALPQPTATDTRACILGQEITGLATYNESLYLVLTPALCRQLGLVCQEGSESGLATLRLDAFGCRLALCDNFRDALINGKRWVFRDPALYRGGLWHVPLRMLSWGCDWSVLRDSENNRVYYDSRVDGTALPAGVKLPVLEYHAVSDDIWDGADSSLFVSPAALEEEIVWLKKQGYTFITFEDLARLGEIEKPVLLTFDDGYENIYSELFPILQRQQVKATVFLIGQKIGEEHHVTAAQVREMAASGLVSVQSHTNTHHKFVGVSKEDCLRDFRQSQLVLARLTGRVPFVLCYPYGKADAAADAAAREAFSFALYVQRTPYGYISGNDPYKIYRHEVVRGTSLSQFKRDFNNWVAKMK